MFASLKRVLIDHNCFLLNFGDLFIHLHYAVLGEKYLFAHNVNLGLEVLIPTHSIIELNFFICEHMQDMSANYLLLMEVLLAGYHLFDFVLLLIELS